MKKVRLAIWLVLIALIVINREAWNYSVWDAPQTEWFHHAIQWDPKYSYLESWGKDLGAQP